MKNKIIIYFLILVSTFILTFQICFADCSGTSQGITGTATVCLDNPLGKDVAAISPQILLGRIISYVMGIIGSLALVMFIYGGATWMLSGGNQERVTKGKNIITWAALGLAIIFTAYALVKFVISAISGAT
jgi:hypothetical protein